VAFKRAQLHARNGANKLSRAVCEEKKSESATYTYVVLEAGLEQQQRPDFRLAFLCMVTVGRTKRQLGIRISGRLHFTVTQTLTDTPALCGGMVGLRLVRA
jgi:hypothetical protein